MRLEFSEKSIEDLKSFTLDEREFIFEKSNIWTRIMRYSQKITALKVTIKGKHL